MDLDRDPRRDPVDGDVMQIGLSVFRVLPPRFKAHVAFRHPQTRPQSTLHITLRDWRRLMADPGAIVVRRGT